MPVQSAYFRYLLESPSKLYFFKHSSNNYILQFVPLQKAEVDFNCKYRYEKVTKKKKKNSKKKLNLIHNIGSYLFI